MISAPVQPRRWAAGRFWAAIGLVLGFQFALVLWLSDRSPFVPLKAEAAPVIRLSSARPEELLPLEDPTLFVLPHENSFSGAWMKPHVPQRPADYWTESPQWLPATNEDLGAAFLHFAGTSAPPVFQTVVMVEPTLTMPQPPAPVPITTRSALHVAGALARRRLLSTPELPPWKSPVVLTNSMVQLLVDPAGNVVSAVLFSSSGWAPADQYALQISRAARFEATEPVGPGRPKNPKPDPMVGGLVFQWQTLLTTNATPTASSP